MLVKLCVSKYLIYVINILSTIEPFHCAIDRSLNYASKSESTKKVYIKKYTRIYCNYIFLISINCQDTVEFSYVNYHGGEFHAISSYLMLRIYKFNNILSRKPILI